MKKSLFALAALGAFAGAAQAQSSVTLFGILDAGAVYIQNGGVAGSPTAAGAITQPTGSSSTDPTKSGPTTGSGFAYYDSAIYSSQWGMKGTEDLGGGLKANFTLIGDANTNNGGTNMEGVFRRAAWAGISGGFGEVRLGTQANPIVTASSNLMPLMGNTANGVRNAVAYSVKDSNRNAIGYLSPMMSGFQVELQYAANNTIDAGLSDGTAVNARAFYSAGNMELNAAYQKRTSMSATGNGAQCGATTAYATNPNGGTANYYAVSGNTASVGTGSTSVTCAAANYGGDVTGYLAGIKYKVTPAIQVGLGWAHGEGDNTNYITGVNDINKAGTAAQVAAGTKSVVSTAPTLYNSNVAMLGVSYQATPALVVGGSYMVTTADSSQYNFQARYNLSKRTMAYFQVNMAKNGAGSNSAGTAYGNFLVMGGQTGTSPSVQVQGMAALPNTTQTAYGVGVAHMF